jgi:L-ascorbate metabolism protein UlaG (beta-lactamase superfamily)
MAVRLRFFGVAAYEIVTSEGKHVVIDPFLNKNQFSPVKAGELKRVDLLLLTHNAADHFGDAPEIIKAHRCPVLCAMDVRHNLVRYHGVDPDLIRPTIWGMLMEAGGVRVRPLESHHWSFAAMPDGQLLSGPAMGFIVEAGPGIRIYHPGDTALTYDMRLWGELYRPTVGLMHVTLPEGEGVSLPHMECYKTGELTPQEAYLASQWLGLKQIIVSHYVDPECSDVKEFLAVAGAADRHDGLAPQVTVLRPGEAVLLDEQRAVKVESGG